MAHMHSMLYVHEYSDSFTSLCLIQVVQVETCWRTKVHLFSMCAMCLCEVFSLFMCELNRIQSLLVCFLVWSADGSSRAREDDLTLTLQQAMLLWSDK